MAAGAADRMAMADRMAATIMTTTIRIAAGNRSVPIKKAFCVDAFFLTENGKNRFSAGYIGFRGEHESIFYLTLRFV
jgi:hypothetical protein